MQVAIPILTARSKENKMFKTIFQNFTTSQESTNDAAQRARTSAALEYDVAVIGAGIGGLAASIYLRQAGLRVVCIEPKPFPHSPVGESLDWSAPALLRELGLSLDELVDEQVATYKRGLRVLSFGKELFTKKVYSWFANWPLGFETLTCHVDRAKFDQKLFEIAQNLGVTFIWERVSTVETQEDRVVACQTTNGQPIRATWFIDASGRAKLFAKAFSIGKSEYGQQKVCLWTHFESESHSKSTVFHVDNSVKYLSWIWEIAITPTKVSVGYITPADELRELRKSGQSVRQILAEALIKHERFAPLLAEQPDYEVSTCSYRSYVNEWACGPNWFIVGEAASMPDPLTSNGVTAALRHAQAATHLMQKAAKPGILSKRQQQLYNTNILQLGHAFNRNIETALYDWPIRQELGLSHAVDIYVMFGYFGNALYSKWEPQGWVGVTLFKIYLIGMRLWFYSFSLMSRLIFHSRQLWRGIPKVNIGYQI
jgi:flavin-dependent dehydrogenase